jgi:hypothetical protein
MPASTRNPPPKLLDEVRQVLRLHHYSIHTERSYVEWIVRCVRFHRMRSREDLFPAEPKIESFLTDLAVHRNVSAVRTGVRWAIESAMVGKERNGFHL